MAHCTRTLYRILKYIDISYIHIWLKLVNIVFCSPVYSYIVGWSHINQFPSAYKCLLNFGRYPFLIQRADLKCVASSPTCKICLHSIKILSIATVWLNVKSSAPIFDLLFLEFQACFADILQDSVSYFISVNVLWFTSWGHALLNDLYSAFKDGWPNDLLRLNNFFSELRAKTFFHAYRNTTLRSSNFWFSP